MILQWRFYNLLLDIVISFFAVEEINVQVPVFVPHYVGNVTDGNGQVIVLVICN